MFRHVGQASVIAGGARAHVADDLLQRCDQVIPLVRQRLQDFAQSLAELAEQHRVLIQMLADVRADGVFHLGRLGAVVR